VRRSLIDPEHQALSIRHQCELLDLPRSTLYYRPAAETEENLLLMRLVDEQYMKTPFYGSRRMAAWLQSEGYAANRKRVQRLMGLMGLEGLTPRRSTSKPAKGHRIFPYLLRNVEITHPNHVWSTDITYIPLRGGYVYLTAVMDWYSRYVLSWRLSNRLEGSFCLEALDEALKGGKPEIFNSDQGSQFTSEEFTSRLLNLAVAVSMDGRGRALDNVFIERLWRSLKQEDIYVKEYGSIDDLYEGLVWYFRLYNHERFHQALDYQTPYQVYHWGRETRSGMGGRSRSHKAMAA
jgi:putative transposase